MRAAQNMLALRRQALARTQFNAARFSQHQFNFPHSFTGTNNSYNEVPVNNKYPEINRDMKEGDVAPIAN